MIVTCQECSTSFQLDETRIPASGARVRCSRCKHAFFLPRPNANADEAIQAVVEEAIASESPAAPAPTRDLPRPAASSPRASAPTLSAAEPDEEDWQFSQEIPAADDDSRVVPAPASAPAPRPDSFDLTGDFGRGLDPGSSASNRREKPTGVSSAGVVNPTSTPTPKANARPPAATSSVTKPPVVPPAPVREESSFGTVDDFSSLIEDEDDAGHEELVLDPSRGSHSGVGSSPTPPRPTAASTAPTTAARSEELDDPESWDLLGEERARSAPTKPHPVARSAPRPMPSKAAAPPSAAPLDLFAEATLPPAHEESSEPSRWLDHASRAGRWVGWSMTLVCVAWVASGFARTEWSRFAERPAPVSIGPVVVETTRVGWLETRSEGWLLVVEGVARNESRSAAAAPLQLALLDETGSPLAEPPIAAGRPISQELLREAPAAVLDVERAEALRQWIAQPLGPGEARPFAIVSMQRELPERARRWRLEPATTASR